MSEANTTDQQTSAPPARDPQQVSPDTLMEDFRGKPIVAIVVFTLIAHVVFIGVFSFGYLRDQVLGEDTSSLSEDERMDIALDEGTKALRQIAERHNVSVQDLSSRFADGRSTRASDTAAEDAGSGTPGAADPPGTSDTTGSDIERELERETPGPPAPDLSGGLEEEDDLFAPN